MVQIGTGNGTKLFRVVQSGTEWYRGVQSGAEVALSLAGPDPPAWFVPLALLVPNLAVVQSGTEWYRVVQSGTKWYRVLQSGAEFVVQCGAESKALVQQCYSIVAAVVQQRCSSGTSRWQQ